MIAQAGHIYAQILGGIVHLVFNAADLPEWCDVTDPDLPDAWPYAIQVIDITATQPAPGVGWSYANGVFTAPAPAVLSSDQIDTMTQSYLNMGASAWGYGNITAAISYQGSSNAQWAAEAAALHAWQDAVWTAEIALLAAIAQGQAQAPANAAALIALLPAEPARPNA